jgi:GNAT superfamily N-acetyltransferase
LTESFEVRRAEDGETRACRLLMPQTFAPAYAPDLWVAIDRETALIVGAAAIAWQPSHDPAGCRLHLHVPPPFRRRGIGRALVETIVGAATGSTRCLHSWADIPDDGPVDFLRAVGFAPSRRMQEYMAEGARFHAMVKRVLDRLAAASRVPPGFRVVPLREAPTEEVAHLVAANFREAPAAALSGIARGLGGHDADKSVVLLDDGVVRGALLYRWNDGDPAIEVRVVAPEARGSAANVMMLEAATLRGLQGGATRFRFTAADDNSDTLKLARRSGASLVAARSTYTRMLVS